MARNDSVGVKEKQVTDRLECTFGGEKKTNSINLMSIK